jgi:hypothetical protein
MAVGHVVLKRYADRLNTTASETAGQQRFSRDVAQLGQRTCFGSISELALCYPASSQFTHDRKWPNKVRSCERLEACSMATVAPSP